MEEALHTTPRQWAGRILLILLVSALLLQSQAAPRIAVAPFEGPDSSAASRQAGRDAAEYVSTFLAQCDQFEVVERAQLARLLEEFALGQSDVIDESTAVKSGKMAGATHVVVGRLSSESAANTVTARLVEVESGLVKGSAIGRAGSRDDALDQVCIKLSQALGVAVVRNRAYTVKRILGWSSAGLCLVGSGLTIWSQLSYSTADEKYRTDYNLTDAQYDDLHSEAELHMNARWYFAGTSAVLLGVGVYAFVSNRAEWLFEETESAVSLLPVVGTDGGGAVIVWQF